jgi:hypothetical protein
LVEKIGGGYLLLRPQVCDVRQTDEGKYYQQQKIVSQKTMPTSSDCHSGRQYSPFKNRALPPFQRERLEQIHASYPV